MFRLAMNCLEVIRENFIEMDMDLGLMEEAYGTFARFNIDVPKEEIERVESLRFNFQNMVTHVSTVKLFRNHIKFYFVHVGLNLLLKNILYVRLVVRFIL